MIKYHTWGLSLQIRRFLLKKKSGSAVGDEEEVPQPGVLPRSQCTQHEEIVVCTTQI